MCYFHRQQNHFLDYFDDPVLEGVVIYVGVIPFQYTEKDGTYTEVLDKPRGKVFLATKTDHKFLLSYRNTVLHTSSESRSSSHNYIDNPSSSKACHMPLLPSNPSDPLNQTYYNRKRDVQAEFVSLIKTVVHNTI